MTITAAILFSGVVSLSLTPMLGSRLLKGKSHIAESDFIFDHLMNWYKKSLDFCIRHRGKTMVASGLLFLATAAAFHVIPKGFLPSDDQGIIMGYTQARQGISYKSLEQHQKQSIPIIAENSDVKGQIQIIGNPLSNQGMAIAILKPADKRTKSLDEVLHELWGPVNSIPGLEVFLVNPPMIQIGGKTAKGDYLYTLLSPDSATLYKGADTFLTELRKNPLLSGVTSDLQDRKSVV